MRLSKRVRWVDHAPVARTIGDLYFRLTYPSGYHQWIRVIGGKSVGYWLKHLLNETNANEVEAI